MTDIVERLRFNAARKSDLDTDKRSLAEAADEIEQLRTAYGLLSDDYKQLRIEIKRLRATLDEQVAQ